MLEERIREMEADLERITGVHSARMMVEGGEISEVHVIAACDRRPKLIARDVITTLFARHGIRIPHQKVSIAAARPIPAQEDRRVSNWRSIEVTSVHMAREGEILRAVVGLREGSKDAEGNAEGLATRANATRVVAAATLSAVRNLTGNRLSLQLEEARRVRFGRLALVVAHVVLLCPEGERSLVGCCTTEDGRFEAVACAVLDAVLRVIDPTPMQEDEVEYVVREDGR
jgi:hypothetical protein